MRVFVGPVTLFVLAAASLAGCYAGPGHTRAAGAAVGTGTGALLGAAVSPCNRAGGALLGGVLGYVAGSTVAEGIAQDQERYNRPRHYAGDMAEAGYPYPAPPPRRVIRRRYVQPPPEVIYEDVIIEEVPPGR